MMPAYSPYNAAIVSMIVRFPLCFVGFFFFFFGKVVDVTFLLLMGNEQVSMSLEIQLTLSFRPLFGYFLPASLFTGLVNVHLIFLPILPIIILYYFLF